MKGALVLAASLFTLVALPASSQAAVSRLSISDVRVVEGNAGTKRAVLSVRRSGPARRKAGLRYTTADGTAKAGSDYSRKIGKLSFRRGQKRKTVVISIRGDTLDEPNETFFVRLSRPKGGRVGRSRARGTIVDDDAPLGLPPLGGGPPTGGGGGGGGATPQVVRFIAFGDQGKGNQGQMDVGAAMSAKCAASGCDFVAGLGDNFYPNGVASTTDSQWQTAFVTPYQNVAGPFYMALGHHDQGGDGAGTDPAKAQHQIDYSQVNPKWKMPARYYQHSHGHAQFFTMDTTPLMFSAQPAQATAVAGWINGSTATWKIALGHHTYRSNGPHGDAGEYDDAPFIPATNGAHVKNFLEANVCGKADVYFSAHDHSLQWLNTPDQCGGTELIVSGAGAATSEFEGTNPTHFQSLELGFVYVVIRDRQLTAEFVGVDGDTLFTRTISK